MFMRRGKVRWRSEVGLPDAGPKGAIGGDPFAGGGYARVQFQAESAQEFRIDEGRRFPQEERERIEYPLARMAPGTRMQAQPEPVSLNVQEEIAEAGLAGEFVVGVHGIGAS